MPQSYSFKKAEHLCSKKTIEALFDRKNTANNGFLVYPIRVVFNCELGIVNLELGIRNQELGIIDEISQPPIPNSQFLIPNSLSPPQVLFSVSKRNFKRAVDRNLIRRRMRESYRLNKNALTLKENLPASVAFIYVAKEICTYSVIEKSMKKILGKF